MDTPFPLWVGAGTMDHKTPTASRPGSRANDVPGLTDQKDTDRLMTSMQQPTDTKQPRPSVCPVCSMYADNGVITRAEVTATATYLDTEGHMWSVTWLEVA